MENEIKVSKRMDELMKAYLEFEKLKDKALDSLVGQKDSKILETLKKSVKFQLNAIREKEKQIEKVFELIDKLYNTEYSKIVSLPFGSEKRGDKIKETYKEQRKSNANKISITHKVLKEQVEKNLIVYENNKNNPKELEKLANYTKRLIASNAFFETNFGIDCTEEKKLVKKVEKALQSTKR